MSSTKLSVRNNPANPNHHLWNNHGTWWCHLTLDRGETKERQRLSLHTGGIVEARERRDRLFATYHQYDGTPELECHVMEHGGILVE